MEHQKTATVIPFPAKSNSKRELVADLEKILAKLIPFYEGDLQSFIDDCTQAQGFKRGEQRARTLRSWARRQLEFFEQMATVVG